MKRTVRKNLLLLMLMSLMAMASCTSYKKVPYIQNSGGYEATAGSGAHEARIMPQDMLNITIVNPQNPEVSMAYNLLTPSEAIRANTLTSQPVLQNYVVSNDGTVCVPTLGTVEVAGKTLAEAEKHIYDLVKGSFNASPTVTVCFADFRISVLGEVTSPGTYTIKNGKVNVFEALALARDLTIWGMRDNVKIIREDKDGKRNVYEVNLNDVNILTSPYYYLQQNDVVYVTPNQSKAKNSDVGSSTSLWFSATSILISMVSLMYNILK
ncbi:MAG: polysaccharide biosynthesis/export family protein [Bacteroidaceae bacterium]|nr:polysaccharide biosynthesis/export family protein [Bacteroidaceae bacterium]